MKVDIPDHDPIETGRVLWQRLLPVVFPVVTCYPDEQQRHDVLQTFLCGAVAFAVSEFGGEKAEALFALMSSASVALAKNLSGLSQDHLEDVAP